MIYLKLLWTAIVYLSVSNAYAESLSLTTANKLSIESAKKIFINYTADGCLPCNIYKEQFLLDERVASLLDSDFVIIESDYDSQDSKVIFEDYASACMHTLHILDQQSEVLNKLSGTMTAAQFYEKNSKYVIMSYPITKENVLVTRPIPVASSMAKSARKIPTEFYTFQADAFSSRDIALRQYNTILSDVSESIEINEDSECNLLILSVGKYDTKEELDLVTIKLKDASIDYFVKSKKRS